MRTLTNEMPIQYICEATGFTRAVNPVVFEPEPEPEPEPARGRLGKTNGTKRNDAT